MDRRDILDQRDSRDSFSGKFYGRFQRLAPCGGVGRTCASAGEPPGIDGIVYVGETRVTLDCVVEMFDHGASPEEIAAEYDSLSLADVYAVLTYYLRNRDAVAALFAKQAKDSDEARRSAGAAFPRHLREKLLRAKDSSRGRGGGDPPSA